MDAGSASMRSSDTLAGLDSQVLNMFHTLPPLEDQRLGAIFDENYSGDCVRNRSLLLSSLTGQEKKERKMPYQMR
ncbi:hypothetical protein ACEQPO_12035 [Bacillus sp. SL00103]